MQGFASIQDVKDLFMHTLHIYPNLAQGVQLPDAAADIFGAWTQIIPANTITRPFFICGIVADNLSAAIAYARVQLAYSANNILIGTYPIDISGALFGILGAPLTPSFEIPANSVINGCLLTDVAAARTIRISVYYRER